MSAYPKDIYNGPEMFVISMDIGTTQSAVCFAHFVPGTPPQTRMVTHWPGQAQRDVLAKVPTIVSYRGGVMQACGEEAMPDLEDDGGNVAHWFKLHLHPPGMPRPPGFKIPKLPPGVSVKRAYADLMRYLMDETRKFHAITTPNGHDIWMRLHNEMIIFLATPNGWNLQEQGIIRTAAVEAGIVSEDNAEQLLRFVPEPEAAVHYALKHYSRSWLQKNTTFVVVDAGGCTVDITVYKCASMDPLGLQVLCASESVQAGDIFVNRAVEKLLSDRLRGSTFEDRRIMWDILEFFEKEVKYKFDGSQPSYHIKFGHEKDTDQSLGINKGEIAISMEDLKKAFDAVVSQIVACCAKVLRNDEAKYILLVGGFGESPYLQKALSGKLGTRKTQLIVAGDHLRVAAAEGATIAYIKKLDVAKPARNTLGQRLLSVIRGR